MAGGWKSKSLKFWGETFFSAEIYFFMADGWKSKSLKFWEENFFFQQKFNFSWLVAGSMK